MLLSNQVSIFSFLLLFVVVLWPLFSVAALLLPIIEDWKLDKPLPPPPYWKPMQPNIFFPANGRNSKLENEQLSQKIERASTVAEGSSAPQWRISKVIPTHDA